MSSGTKTKTRASRATAESNIDSPATAKTRSKKTVATTVTSGEVPSDTPVEAPVKTTRKKQFQVVALVTPDGIEGSLQPEIRKPLIAHLPIQSKNVSFFDNVVHYDPNPPGTIEPYDSSADTFFSNDVAAYASEASVSAVTQVEEKKKEAVITATQQPQTNHDSYRNAILLVQFKESSEVKALPEETDVACFWCCHPFKGRPVVLPIRDEGEYLQVYGNFCCPECAMAYLFDMRQDSHTRWEQLALLNRVYSDYVGGKIKPAPHRSVLKMFGGPMSIDEFRDIITQKKVRVDIHIPPMVSLLSTMDTKPIDFYDANLTKDVMETVKERLQKAEEVLKLRRTKPLKAWESTLDACINLRVRPSEKV
jgi:hypothetical protein